MLTSPIAAGRPPPPHDVLRTWLLAILVIVAVLTALSLASPVFIPIFTVMFVAAVLRPPIRGLMRLGLDLLLDLVRPVFAHRVEVFAEQGEIRPQSIEIAAKRIAARQMTVSRHVPSPMFLRGNTSLAAEFPFGSRGDAEKRGTRFL